MKASCDRKGGEASLRGEDQEGQGPALPSSPEAGARRWWGRRGAPGFIRTSHSQGMESGGNTYKGGVGRSQEIQKRAEDPETGRRQNKKVPRRAEHVWGKGEEPGRRWGDRGVGGVRTMEQVEGAVHPQLCPGHKRHSPGKM